MIKNKKIKNTKPRVFYGLHFCEGVVEYPEEKEDFRLLITEEVAKEMDKTFAGCHVYVEHTDDITDYSRKDIIPDGYVVKSFYNPVDGKHWVQFIVTTDEGLNAIENQYNLSNSYIPTEYEGGGEWHAVSYEKKVVTAHYDHLALVKHPRYTEAMILTPEEFKNYNEEKEQKLKQCSNSTNIKKKNEKKGKSKMLKFFRKQAIDNDIDIEEYSVTLEESKKEMTVSEALEIADAQLVRNGIANGEDTIKVDGEEMTVKSLKQKYVSMKKQMDKMKDAKNEADDKMDDEADDKMDDMGDDKMDDEADDKMDDEADDKMDDEDDRKEDEYEEEKQNSRVKSKARVRRNKQTLKTKNPEKIKNANELLEAKDKFIVEGQEDFIPTVSDKIERGVSRYGS